MLEQLNSLHDNEDYGIVSDIWIQVERSFTFTSDYINFLLKLIVLSGFFFCYNLFQGKLLDIMTNMRSWINSVKSLSRWIDDSNYTGKCFSRYASTNIRIEQKLSIHYSQPNPACKLFISRNIRILTNNTPIHLCNKTLIDWRTINV